MTRDTGLLIFAHGARDPLWARPFEQIAEAVRAARPGVPVRLAFLEFMSPDLVAAGQELVQAGCTRVDVVPAFLGAGGHVRKDIPVLLERLRTEHPHVTWTLRATLGEEAAVIAAMAAATAAHLDRGAP